MSLSLPSQFTTRAAERVQHPVFAVHLDIDTDPLTVWTGPGTAVFTGDTDTILAGLAFDSVGKAPVQSIGPVSQGPEGVSDCVLAIGGPDLNVDGMKQFIRDRRVYQGRKGYVWWGFLDEDYRNPVVTRYYTGVMKQMKVDIANPAISVSLGRDPRPLKAQPRYLSRHKEIWPDDTAVDALVSTANGKTGPDAPTVPANLAWPTGPFTNYR